MSLLRDADPRFRYLDLKVALFVVLGLAASVGLLVALAAQQGYFTPKVDLRVVTPTGTDLRPGMAVKLSGFKIGEVKAVSLNESARVDVQLRIEERYMKWVKADSAVSVAREGLIGDSYLAVRSGTSTLPSLRSGDTLTYEPSPALADIAADLRARTIPVIEGTSTLLAYLNDPRGDFRVAMADLRKLTGELRETRRKIDRLVDDVDAVARDDVRRTLATVEREVGEMSARTGQSLVKLDAATESARAAAQAATTAIDTASPKVNRLLDNTDGAVRDARKLMDGAGKRWPFKGGKPPDQGTGDGDAAAVPP